MQNFEKDEYKYTAGMFPDVALASWYTPYVPVVYEAGLMKGNLDGTFNPGGNVTLAETIALAARLHSIYYQGKADFKQGADWYQVYLDYLVENEISVDDTQDYNRSADRLTFADLLARALPNEAYSAINEIEEGIIPDLDLLDTKAPQVYLLYRAGVLTGNDEYGTFAPKSYIRRSEVAAILARIINPSLRQTVQLAEVQKYPTLTERERKEDDFFSDAAMLGNSLVDGMMLCSGIKMSYYGGTALTVFNNKLSTLLQKEFGKIYIEFGINEFGCTVEAFIEEYTKIIERIREVLPEAEIYIMAITPVTQARSNEGTFTMKRIATFNEALKNMAEEEQCWYLDCCTPLCDSSGYLPKNFGGWDASPHLSADGYLAWAEVIRTHYAD